MRTSRCPDGTQVWLYVAVDPDTLIELEQRAAARGTVGIERGRPWAVMLSRAARAAA